MKRWEHGPFILSVETLVVMLLAMVVTGARIASDPWSVGTLLAFICGIVIPGGIVLLDKDVPSITKCINPFLYGAYVSIITLGHAMTIFAFVLLCAALEDDKPPMVAMFGVMTVISGLFVPLMYNYIFTKHK